jgi:rhodanese-related sulfurtransferase
MTLEMVVDKPTRRVLGVQGFGSSGDAMVGRINAVAALLKSAPTIDDVSNMELAYAPPFASAMDILNTLANLADNALNGINRGVGPAGFKELWDNRDKDACFFLDCRERGDADPFVERNPGFWYNVPQGEIYDRLAEIPKDRPIVLVCNTGARSYEAQIMLDDKGYKDVTNIHGGMAAIKKYGIDF